MSCPSAGWWLVEAAEGSGRWMMMVDGPSAETSCFFNSCPVCPCSVYILTLFGWEKTGTDL
jgi:hypothetical protein